MGYFPNGSEADAWQAANCHARCIHWKDDGDGRGDGCPVYDVHEILRLLIPETRGPWGNDRCSMYAGLEAREGER